ncbi:MAG: peptide deformylase [Alphaproteobacteria bacterium]|nr:peptide deformylase [Alphaproteobacteria bacterium]
MAIRPIIRVGDPVLATVAAPVQDPTSDDVAHLVADMIDTFVPLGSVGIAAPQIGVSQRVVTYLVPPHRVTGRAGDDPIGITVLINPVVEPIGEGRTVDWDGCLSVPGMRGRTSRWERVRVTATDLDGKRTERVVAGAHARIVQHECDHLDGVIYVKHLAEPESLGYMDELVASGRMPPWKLVDVKQHLRGQTALLRRLERAGRPMSL